MKKSHIAKMQHNQHKGMAYEKHMREYAAWAISPRISHTNLLAVRSAMLSTYGALWKAALAQQFEVDAAEIEITIRQIDSYSDYVVSITNRPAILMSLCELLLITVDKQFSAVVAGKD